MWQQLRPALVVFAVLTGLTGMVYPGVVTVLAQAAFRQQANGSLIYHKGKPVGSALVGQAFASPQYFWGRLSATMPFAYNAAASSGSNYGPLHPSVRGAAEDRIAALTRHGPRAIPIPVDLVTSSASGLDPHISPAAAEVQVPRVAAARRMPEEQVRALVRRHTQPRQFGILGEPRVNVLELNLALDGIASEE